jgi:hypothetical protein
MAGKARSGRSVPSCKPVVLGQGQPLLSAPRSPVDLRLIGAIPLRSGAMAVVYQPA